MKYLVVGLGNIGAEYADTRHNIGFKVLDCLAEQSNIAFTTGRYGATAELRYKGRTLVLLKPSTYMNLSGKAVRYWMEAEKIAPENLLVVVDDIALPFGTLRMRPHPFRHRRRFRPRASGGLRAGVVVGRRAQGAARAAESLRRGRSLLRHDRRRTHDEPLQQAVTRPRRHP